MLQTPELLVLKAVGIEYPKVHDVSDVLMDVNARFPAWFPKEMDYMCESSKRLVKKREPSLYGGEEAFLSPNEVINKADAKDAVKRAKNTFQLCHKLISQLQKSSRKRLSDLCCKQKIFCGAQ